MINGLRFALIWLAFTSSLNGVRALAATSRVPVVVISVDREFTTDGWYGFEISESGRGPTGNYRRTFVFRANIKKGIAIPSEFRSYEAAMSTEKAGVWRTRREPISGYMRVFVQQGRTHAELRLIEAWDGHPTKMSINGTHLLRVKPGMRAQE